MKEDLKKVKNVTEAIQADKDLTYAMDELLKEVNKEVGDFDHILVNISLADAADKALAQELAKSLSASMVELQSALDFLHHVTTTEGSSSTLTPITTPVTHETVAVQSLVAINETFNLMVVQLDQDLHPEWLKMATNESSQLSVIFDQAMDVIEAINKTKADLDITDGVVSGDVLDGIKQCKNQSLDIYNSLQNIQLNLTSGDQELGEIFISKLDEAQEVVKAAITLIRNHKPTTLEPHSTSPPEDSMQQLVKVVQKQISYLIDQKQGLA